MSHSTFEISSTVSTSSLPGCSQVLNGFTLELDLMGRVYFDFFVITSLSLCFVLKIYDETERTCFGSLVLCVLVAGPQLTDGITWITAIHRGFRLVRPQKIVSALEDILVVLACLMPIMLRFPL